MVKPKLIQLGYHNHISNIKFD